MKILSDFFKLKIPGSSYSVYLPAATQYVENYEN